jgi:hypothetical protein
MLSEGRGKPSLSCAGGVVLAGTIMLAFIGGWVVAGAIIGWLT